jgi:hypothetical protein
MILRSYATKGLLKLVWSKQIVETFPFVVNILWICKLMSSGKSRSKNQGLYYLYLEAVSVRNLKSCAVSGEEIRASGICDLRTCTERDCDFAVSYKKEHGADVFRQILQSFCPSIYGHELVKGILYPIILYFILILCYIYLMLLQIYLICFVVLKYERCGFVKSLVPLNFCL